MNETILRQWSMLRHIPRIPRKTSAPMLLTRLEDDGFKTTLRTIQRDLNLLAISFPLQSDDAKPQGWSWSKDSLQFDLPAQDYRTACPADRSRRTIAAPPRFPGARPRCGRWRHRSAGEQLNGRIGGSGDQRSGTSKPPSRGNWPALSIIYCGDSACTYPLQGDRCAA
jgi:hypothetical protein